MASQNNMIEVECFRFDPESDKKPRFQSYKVPFQENMSVLNVLDYIFENLDNTLGYVSFCRHGVCGECKVKVNGRKGLACKMLAQKKMRIEPVSADKVVRDLIVLSGR